MGILPHSEMPTVEGCAGSCERDPKGKKPQTHRNPLLGPGGSGRVLVVYRKLHRWELFPEALFTVLKDKAHLTGPGFPSAGPWFGPVLVKQLQETMSATYN